MKFALLLCGGEMLTKKIIEACEKKYRSFTIINRRASNEGCLMAHISVDTTENELEAFLRNQKELQQYSLIAMHE